MAVTATAPKTVSASTPRPCPSSACLPPPPTSCLHRRPPAARSPAFYPVFTLLLLDSQAMGLSRGSEEELERTLRFDDIPALALPVAVPDRTDAREVPRSWKAH